MIYHWECLKACIGESIIVSTREKPLCFSNHWSILWITLAPLKRIQFQRHRCGQSGDSWTDEAEEAYDQWHFGQCKSYLPVTNSWKIGSCGIFVEAKSGRRNNKQDSWASSKREVQIVKAETVESRYFYKHEIETTLWRPKLRLLLLLLLLLLFERILY